MSDALDAKVAARRQAELVANLRRLSKPGATNGAANGEPDLRRTSTAAAGEEFCDLCGKPIDHDHRHLLHLVDRRILCTCESCLAMRGGDAELRPTGTRFAWLDDFDMSDEAWAIVRDPDRPRVLHRLERHRQRRGALPEPGRRDRVGDRRRELARPEDREPGPDGARVRRRGPARQPDGRRAASTRSRRSTSATGSSGWSRSTGRGSRAAPGSSARSRRSSTRSGRSRREGAD